MRKDHTLSPTKTIRKAAALLLEAAPHLLTDRDQSASPDPLEIVLNASFQVLLSGNQGHPFRYLYHKLDDGKATTKEVIETKEGSISRLLEVNGQPLDADANAKELARLNALRDDPAAQARRHKREQTDGGRADEMVKLLPSAFVYTYLGMVPGPNGPCYRLKFEPNPNFNPPDREAEVYHGMEGELWVDQGQQRMVRFDAHLIADVNFGWGFVGRLFKGGTILVDQKDVGEHHWETTSMRLHLSGKILMVKALDINTTESFTNFEPVPNDGYQAAIQMLESPRFAEATAGNP